MELIFLLICFAYLCYYTYTVFACHFSSQITIFYFKYFVLSYFMDSVSALFLFQHILLTFTAIYDNLYFEIWLICLNHSQMMNILISHIHGDSWEPYTAVNFLMPYSQRVSMLELISIPKVILMICKIFRHPFIEVLSFQQPYLSDDTLLISLKPSHSRRIWWQAVAKYPL